jgi:chromosomal replication initiation ATPase DnaA
MADLDSTFTFENFVVGPANRLASAAARRAAEVPGASYNPLFVYSASGLGKTHILGAIAHYVRKIHSDKEVVYQTLEGYLEELTESLEGGDRDLVRNRYENLDILLMDDVQFLTGQVEAQEILLRALDNLTGEGKQVVLASDRPPLDIDGLDARLRSRFEGGLLVDIGPPEYETRVAIIRRRAEARDQTLSQGVAEAIARVPFRNVRKLGGALNRVLAVQELEDRSVTAEEVPALLGEEEPSPRAEGDGAGARAPAGTPQRAEEPQEAPWRRRLREAAETVEEESFKADRLRRLLEREAPPADVDTVVDEFLGRVDRLRDIAEDLEAVGNPWPEAAHGVLRDPERLDEAETLLASARERARPFPDLPPGPDLEGLTGEVPRLVLRATYQLINTDRHEYNPLYVWEESGDRARTLLMAAGRSYRQNHDSSKVALVSVAEFAEEFISALSQGVAGAWRERWWSADLLLVHGAEELAATERAQDEFFHLFEALQRRGARVMVAANRPPSRIGTIDDRLRSRFEGGLVLEVEPGDGEGEGGEEEDLDIPWDQGMAQEPFIPPLDQLMERDGERGGLFAGGEFEMPPAPPTPGPDTEGVRAGDQAAAGGEAEGPEGPGGPEEQVASDPIPAGGRDEDPAAQDREWIRQFTGGQTGSGKESSPVEEGEVLPPGSWIPSPEVAVWEWPRIEDRLVQEAD